MNYVETVVEFHKKFGIVPGGPGATLPKRIRLMAEETAEVIVALDENNLIELADGLADLVYVIAGSMDALGFMPVPTKLPEIDGIEPSIGMMTQKVAVSTILIQSLAEVTDRLADHSGYELERNALLNFIEVCKYVAALYHIPFDLVFQEVHRSNMTKEPLNEHGKGGKGPNFEPPNIRKILEEYHVIEP